MFAATKAGYAHPNAAGYNALARPAIAGEVRRHQLERLENEVFPLAIDLLARVLSDRNEATRNQLTAAKIAIDANQKMRGEADERHVNEKSAAELRAMADLVEQRLAELAIDVTPHESAQDAPNIFD